MDIANSLIETSGIIIVALIGFATIAYQISKSREENVRDHGMVMDKLTEVAEELQYLDEDLAVIDAKIDSHLQNDAVHRSKKTSKKK